MYDINIHRGDSMIAVEVKEYGGLTVINIDGEFYIDSIQYIEKVWNEKISGRPRVVGINCKKIKYIDSSAIGILVKFHNNAKKLGIDLVFFDLSETVVSVFRTAKLDDFFITMSLGEFESNYLENKV